ncbi:MAG TPA: hypothetical protein VHP61_07990 [Acidobacteriota bacterium]|nr:hypothetical protein [Acidobacteriota bacterium]
MAASKIAGVLVAFSALAFVSALRLFPRTPSPQKSDVSAAPGPLSVFHAERPGIKTCSSCHTPDGEAAPAKCLSCHDEIASRIKEGRGFHRDKAEGCGTCHAEHQGPDAKLVPLDPEDFDHGETGFVLEGDHARVKECESCHYGKAAFRRTNGRSYLLRDARCSACHDSPHPGRQEECLTCHSMEGWGADRGSVVKW